MFSREDYYKLFNSRREAKYQELRAELERHISSIPVSSDKGFRERMNRYSKAMGDYLMLLCQLEEGRTEEYLKTASLKDLQEDQNHFFGMILKENYVSDMASTTYMNTMVRDIGPVLAMFTAEFIRGAEDAICHRRFMLAKKIELYFELHKRLGKGQVRAENLAGLLREYMSQNAAMEEEMRILKNYSPSDETNTEIVASANLMEPYYLYELGTPVGSDERGWQRFFASMESDTIEKIADAVVEGFTGSLTKETNSRGYRRYNGFDRSYESSDDREERVYEPEMVRNLIAIDYPLGCEMIVRAIMEKLREKGYSSFVREITTTAISEAFKRDHQGDPIRSMDRAVMENHAALTESIAKDNKCLLKSYLGAIRIVMPEEKAYSDLQQEMHRARSQGGRVQRPAGRYSIGAAEEKRKMYREFLLEEETVLRSVGLMENTHILNVTFPAFEETENFPETFDNWMQISLMEHHAERSLKAFADAMDKGSFIYLQGGMEKNAEGEDIQNETDLLIAMRTLKDPSKETNVQTSSTAGNLPCGSVRTIPQKMESNGVLHLVHAVIDGTEFTDLKLTFEDGMLVDYTAGGFEEEEEAKKFVRDKLLHGGFDAALAEFAMGVHSQLFDAAYSEEMQGILPEAMREAFDVSIVLGENCMEREDYCRMNPISHKKVCVYEEEIQETEEVKEAAAVETNETAAETNEAEVKEETEESAASSESADEKEGGKKEGSGKEESHRRRYSFPLRRRISIPYGSIGSLKIINENGSFNDIYRGRTFVLIGTDPLNMLMYKGQKS